MEHEIKVKTITKHGIYTGFVVSGHANSAPHGQDIVCAAVSAIVQTTILGLRRYVGMTSASAEGVCFASITNYNSRDGYLAVAILMETMMAGLSAIDATHPGYLSFEEEEIV